MMSIEIFIGLFLYVAGFFLSVRYCVLHDNTYSEQTSRFSVLSFSVIWPVCATIICAVDVFKFLSQGISQK